MTNCFKCPNFDQCAMVKSAKYLLDKTITHDDILEAQSIITELKAKETMLREIRKTLESKYTPL